MGTLRQDQAGPHPVYSAINPNAAVGGGGVPTSADRPAKVLQESWRGRKDEGDPAADIPGMPPNFGDGTVPHVITFQGIVSSVARIYRPSDEAIKDSFENARYMRNDCSIMECLEQRKRSTALLDWRLEPEDENDKTQKWLCEKLAPIIKQIPRFMQYRESLLEALWYGKYAVQHRYRWKKVEGMQRLVIDKWLPILGDKLVFRYDDGTQEYDPDQVGIRVGAGFTTGSSLAKRWSKDRINKVEPTDYGLAYMLEPFERDLIAIHKHQIEDGEYEEPRNAGRIHGIGIRSRIYWTWFQKQESLAWLMEFLERSAFGIEIWYYPWGNSQAKEKTMEAAKERIGQGRNIVLVPRPLGEEGMAYGVERIEPGMQGADVLKDILTSYFGHQIKRYILGQVLTTEAESTGLGSNLASIHLDTYLQIVKYDSINLQETLTTDLVDPLKKLNFPKFADVPVKFVIDTESPDVEGKLQAWRQAYEMGCRLKERDVMDLIGAEKPEEDDDVLQDPQIAGAGEQAEAQAQAAEYDRQTAERQAGHQEQLDDRKLEHEGAMAEKEAALEEKKMAITAETEQAKMQAQQQQATADAQFKQQAAAQAQANQAQANQVKQQNVERDQAIAQQQTAQAEQTDWSASDYKQAGYQPKNENAERKRVGQYAKKFEESDHPRDTEGKFSEHSGGSGGGELPERTADTMSDAIAQSSPSGRTSKRAAEASQKKLSENLFGKGGLAKPKGPQWPERDRLLHMAKELRGLAERGLGPRKNLKEAERLEAQVAEMDNGERFSRPRAGETPSEYMDRMLGAPGSKARKLGDPAAYQHFLQIWDASQRSAEEAKVDDLAAGQGSPDDRQKSLFAKAYYGESTIAEQNEFWNGGAVGEITTVEDCEPMRYSRDAAGGASVQRYARFKPAAGRF